MYPFTMHFTCGDHNTIQPVVISGYTDNISIGAFKRLNLTVPYNLMREKWYQEAKLGYKAYSYNWSYQSHENIESKERFNKCIGDGSKVKFLKEKTLQEFYKEIGYEPKKKHFNGVTLRKHIINCIKKES